MRPEPNLKDIALLGAPIEVGCGRPGCGMGPAALRTADLAGVLRAQGHRIRDLGDVTPDASEPIEVVGTARQPGLIAAWTRAIDRAGHQAAQDGALPVFLGGDHSLSMGSVNAMARIARDQGRPLVVLWLDAHSDFNTPLTSPSGNMHGMPVAAAIGEPDLDFVYDGIDRPRLDATDFHLLGIRSIDREERELVASRGINVMDMRLLDEHGVARLLEPVLESATARNAMVHVSLDVDFLDPDIAPGVGTCVPGGATYREAHLIMEMLHDADLVTSLDLAELNPFLDDRGRSALLLVELVASLFGKKIIDRAPPRLAS